MFLTTAPNVYARQFDVKPTSTADIGADRDVSAEATDERAHVGEPDTLAGDVLIPARRNSSKMRS